MKFPIKIKMAAPCRLKCMLWVSLLLTSLSHGQEPELITRTFQVIPLDNVVENVFYLDAQNGPTDLMAIPGRRSRTFTYTGPRSFTLYKERKNPDGATVNIAVGSFEFSGETKNWLFLIRKATGAEEYTIDGFPENLLSQNEGGNYSFINATKVPIVGMFGKERFTMAPNGMKVLYANDQTGPERVQLAFRRGDNWNRFYSRIWSISQDHRWTLLIVPSIEKQSLSIVQIQEKLPD